MFDTLKKYLNEYKNEFKNCIQDLKDIKTFYKQIPNLLTLSRAVGMIPVNILFFSGNTISAVVLIGILLVTDFFDGKIARKYKIESKFGADLDAICDKIMVLGLILPLLSTNPLLILNLLFEGLITYVNVVGRLRGIDTKTLYVGKVKTWFLSLTLGMGYLIKVLGIGSSLLRVSSFITLISQGVTFGKYLSEYNKIDKNVEVIDNNEIIENNVKNRDREEMIRDLIKEKEFLLSTLEPNKKYSGKKRIREMLKKKNS